MNKSNTQNTVIGRGTKKKKKAINKKVMIIKGTKQEPTLRGHAT